VEPPAFCDCTVLDGAVIVTGVTTFQQHADEVFIPYLKKQLQSIRRMDIVWDTYITASLKESTREKRGKGVRIKVSG